MKGIIFNLLEEVVRKDYGDETWEDLLEAGQVDGAYTSPGKLPRRGDDVNSLPRQRKPSQTARRNHPMVRA